MATLNRERIDAEHFVARYAQGTLGEADAEAFEEFCLLNPELAEDVGADRALIEAMRAIEAARRPRFSRTAGYALAAGIVVAVIGLGFWFGSKGSGTQRDALYRAGIALPVDASSHVAPPRRVVLLRDGAALPLDVPADATALPLEIEPAITRGAPRVRVSLAEETDGRWDTRGTIDEVGVPPGEEAAVDVTIDLTKLTSTHLRVTLKSDDGRTDEFELRIVRSPQS